MIRYTNGPWQFSFENPETVVAGFQTDDRIVTESGRIPDIVGRYNFNGDWVGYRHWRDERRHTSINVDAVIVDNDATLTGGGANR